MVDRVRHAVLGIPRGQVAAYGDIGQQIGADPRQVGRAMSTLAELQDDAEIPWWRVVRADGTPASCHDRSATALLAEEHTPMAGKRVDMNRARRRSAHGRPPRG
ncbi:MAG: MGMT family protein [Acidimicrobiales bacterium]